MVYMLMKPERCDRRGSKRRGPPCFPRNKEMKLCFVLLIVVSIVGLPILFLAESKTPPTNTMTRRHRINEETEKTASREISLKTLAKLFFTFIDSNRFLPMHYHGEQIIKNLLRLPLLRNDYDFILLPKVQCQGQLMVLVASAPGNFEAREAVRNTWAKEFYRQRPINAYDRKSSGKAADVRNTTLSVKDITNKTKPIDNSTATSQKFSVVFFISAFGKETKKPKQLIKTLAAEVRKYGDLAVSNFTDNFANLSLKTISMLNWIDHACPANVGGFVLKCDDDTYVNIPVMVKILTEQVSKVRSNYASHFVIGFPLNFERPVRLEDSKFFVPYADYKHALYPPGVSGAAYAMRLDTAKLLYQVALRTPIIRLENIYLTGICGSRIELQVVADYRFGINGTTSCELARLASSNSYRPEEMVLVHQMMNDPSLCPRDQINT